MWVALANPQTQLEKVLNELRASAVPTPSKIINVAGHVPGSNVAVPFSASLIDLRRLLPIALSRQQAMQPLQDSASLQRRSCPFSLLLRELPERCLTLLD